MKLDLEKYQKQNIEKLDVKPKSVGLEPKHLEFIKLFNINLSALVRDVLDKLMAEKEEKEDHEK